MSWNTDPVVVRSCVKQEYINKYDQAKQDFQYFLEQYIASLFSACPTLLQDLTISPFRIILKIALLSNIYLFIHKPVYKIFLHGNNIPSLPLVAGVARHAAGVCHRPRSQVGLLVTQLGLQQRSWSRVTCHMARVMGSWGQPGR